jgi:hypothetical protein
VLSAAVLVLSAAVLVLSAAVLVPINAAERDSILQLPLGSSRFDCKAFVREYRRPRFEHEHEHRCAEHDPFRLE